MHTTSGSYLYLFITGVNQTQLTMKFNLNNEKKKNGWKMKIKLVPLIPVCAYNRILKKSKKIKLSKI